MVVKLLALDIDGVLTDGHFTINAGGEEVKRLDFHDLDALTAFRNSGIPVVLVTGETTPLVETIARRFGIELVISGAKDKLNAVRQIAANYNLSLADICYVGDSDRDAPALSAVGLGLAPANATPAAQAAAHRVLKRAGGSGAAAEVIDLLCTTSRAEQYTDDFRRIVQDSISAHKRFLDTSLPILVQVADVFVQALRGGHKLMFFGNGGSAADAQHIAGEIVGRFLRESEPWSALALTTDTSILTAVGNDWEYADVFSRQVRALARPGDVVIGITTSGNSSNVLRGLEAGRMRGAATIGFTGGKGGKMRDYCDVFFCAPADITPRIQELHLLAWHSICEIVENILLDESG